MRLKNLNHSLQWIGFVRLVAYRRLAVKESRVHLIFSKNKLIKENPYRVISILHSLSRTGILWTAILHFDKCSRAFATS